jgi:hypothetical protein
VSLLGTEILGVYDAREYRIHPFIGQAYEDADAGALRVMTIGINAYLNPADWPNQNPTWFAGWFKEGTYAFDRAVARDAATIANALTANSALYSDLAFRGKDGIFHTNAIKTYLPESIGKRSDQVSPQEYLRHVPTWHAELDILAKHGVLPHVVIVFGRPFWDWAWQAFHPRYRPNFAHVKVHGFEPASGEGLHYANLIDIEDAGGRHSLALLGVRHPAARASSKATPEWVLSLADVRTLLRFR